MCAEIFRLYGLSQVVERCQNSRFEGFICTQLDVQGRERALYHGGSTAWD